jgi:hypothetical protein
LARPSCFAYCIHVSSLLCAVPDTKPTKYQGLKHLRANLKNLRLLSDLHDCTDTNAVPRVPIRKMLKSASHTLLHAHREMMTSVVVCAELHEQLRCVEGRKEGRKPATSSVALHRCVAQHSADGWIEVLCVSSPTTIFS